MKNKNPAPIEVRGAPATKEQISKAFEDVELELNYFCEKFRVEFSSSLGTFRASARLVLAEQLLNKNGLAITSEELWKKIEVNSVSS